MFNKEKLREKLKEKGVSNFEFAAQIGVTHPFVTYLLQGYKEPSLKVAKRIADFFGMTVDDFLSK